MKHRERHPNLDVPNCFGCKVAGLNWSSNSTTTRGSKVAEINSTEKNWNKDLPAYKRLRDNGLQPKSVDGAADLERTARSAAEVEGRPDIEKLVARGVAE